MKRKTAEVSFEATTAEINLVDTIVRRVHNIYRKMGRGREFDRTSTTMDLLATHANGCPMDFARLAKADEFNLMHDVGGIAQHLDRKTGKLMHCFLPRFHLRAQQLSDKDPAIVHKSVMKKLGRSHG